MTTESKLKIIVAGLEGVVTLEITPRYIWCVRYLILFADEGNLYAGVVM